MAIDGFMAAGSSKLAAVTAKMFSVHANSGDPHSPQNSRVIILALSFCTV
jgi:hypothetical protein